MTLRTKLILLLNGFLMALLWGGSGGVSAHTPVSDWYPAKWPSSDLIVNWKFENTVPANSALRARIKDGAQQWTNSASSAMNFSFSSTGDYGSYAADRCPAVGSPQKNGIHWGEIDNQYNTYGTTWLCSYYDAGGIPYNSTTLHSFQIKFDRDENWNTDTSAPTGTEWDMWVAAAHEFGHATGRGSTMSLSTQASDGSGHFPTTWAVCNQTSSEHHTMCKSNPMDKTWDRSLNTHDLDIFNAAY